MRFASTIRSFSTEKTAANVVLLILSAIIVFHVLVLSGLIPYHIVWGGKLKDHSQMLVFETVSITINLLIIFIVAMKAGYIKMLVPGKIIKGILWAMFALFLLNTVGNIFAENDLERIIFTPLTLILSLCCLRLAIEN